MCKTFCVFVSPFVSCVLGMSWTFRPHGNLLQASYGPQIEHPYSTSVLSNKNLLEIEAVLYIHHCSSTRCISPATIYMLCVRKPYVVYFFITLRQHYSLKHLSSCHCTRGMFYLTIVTKILQWLLWPLMFGLIHVSATVITSVAVPYL